MMHILHRADIFLLVIYARPFSVHKKTMEPKLTWSKKLFFSLRVRQMMA